MGWAYYRDGYEDMKPKKSWLNYLKKILKFNIMEKQLREAVNLRGGWIYDNYFDDHGDDWHLLTVGMDVIGDTSEAIREFVENGFTNDNIGINYLYLYGVLQSVYAQQDAIKEIVVLFEKHFSMEFPNEKTCKLKYPNWFEIREYRNKIIGHPTNHKAGERTRRTFISRISIDGHAFEVMVCENGQKYSVEQINLLKAINAYCKEVDIIINQISNNLINYIEDGQLRV